MSKEARIWTLDWLVAMALFGMVISWSDGKRIEDLEQRLDALEAAESEGE